MSEALQARWRDGGTALGLWLSLRDPLIAEIGCTTGYDYVCIDMQHGMHDFTDAVAALQAMARGTATPLVRVPWNEQGIIGRVLDAGALGVIIPMVNTPEEAERAVASCRYAPTGARSIGPLRATVAYGADYVAGANDRVACIPMIETKEAIERIDDILAVPGIDAAYVGPADLSLSYGLTPGMDNPSEVFSSALDAVIAACGRHGVVPGIHSSAALADKRHAAGFRMITVGSDVGAMMAGVRRDIETARQATH
jgi:4-hydroxy-2-oxoheptanedioate aldolase